MKKQIAMALCLALAAASLSACGAGAETSTEASTAVSEAAVTEAATEAVTEAETEAETAAEAETEAEAAPEDEEDYNTGDASLDNIRNQDEIGDNELLVLSFGTSFNDSRRLTIGAIENDLEKAFPDYSVRRGFTANIIIDHVERRDGMHIDDVNEALDRAVANGVKNLVVQPTHLMDGLEYHDLVDQVGQYADAFDKVSFGKPLLTSDEDFKRVEQAIVDWTKEYDDGETAIVFMGHGTEADSNAVYQKMQDLLTADGYEHYYIGTVEATPSADDVLAAVQAGEYKRVILEPLMVVAGDHANNDMAGDEEDSWKTKFTDAGYEVTCLLRGLGENEAIRQLYTEHAKAAIDEISE
ncbi:MAG: sirohydrochlorin cobaltochelatase [Oscillospiraceae bacterium]|nr:sirohydrochlorin cobaltochelatase [Oscillospiraceae bacterium]